MPDFTIPTRFLRIMAPSRPFQWHVRRRLRHVNHRIVATLAEDAQQSAERLNDPFDLLWLAGHHATRWILAHLAPLRMRAAWYRLRHIALAPTEARCQLSDVLARGAVLPGIHLAHLLGARAPAHQLALALVAAATAPGTPLSILRRTSQRLSATVQGQQALVDALASVSDTHPVWTCVTSGVLGALLVSPSSHLRLWGLTHMDRTPDVAGTPVAAGTLPHQTTPQAPPRPLSGPAHGRRL